jgi:hypothetical protein
VDDSKDPKVERHLNTILLREAKLIVKNYEYYLLDKITSKQLAEKMLSLSHIIKRIEDFKD